MSDSPNRSFDLRQVPASKLDALRQVAAERGCLGLMVDQGDRLVLIDDVEVLPGDRLLVVDEDSLRDAKAEFAKARVLTINDQFGFRVTTDGTVKPWRVDVTRESRRRPRDQGPASAPLDTFLSVSETLRRFGISRSAFYDMVRNTDLEHILVRVPPGTGRIRVPARRFEEWLRTNR
jgi:hypothetical protein